MRTIKIWKNEFVYTEITVGEFVRRLAPGVGVLVTVFIAGVLVGVGLK